MPLSVSQNWDSVTPPALPSDWTADAAFVTSASHAYTSPNGLVLSDATSTKKYATYSTADPDGGATITAASKFYVATGSPVGISTTLGVTIRCSSATMDNATTSCYWACLLFDSSLLYATLYFSKIVNGTATTIASQQNTDQTINTNLWYNLSLAASGGTFNVSLQRMSDGYYMNSAGNFVSATPTYALASVSDSSIASGGYSGLCALSSRSGRVFFDDGTISTATGTVILSPHAPVVVRWPFQYYHPD